MNELEKKMLEREALRNMIQQWNTNRLDLFELSEPNEDLVFHGVMRFYFQDSGQKVATKCIRVASDATVSDVIEILIEKFRPDMRMLSVSSYALYEIHSQEERKLASDEKPLLVQLNWHLDDREGRFLLKNIDEKTSSVVSGADTNANFKRKLSKREKKELKKKEKLSRLKSDATNDDKHSVAEKLYTELPETSFTRSISNPEAVMRRRRQQILEKKLQQFRSKDGGPDTGGTLKIYGESLCSDVPYKTLLLSINDCAAVVVREMLDKYGLGKNDPQLYCLVQVNTQDNSEYILDDDECPLAIVMGHVQRGSIMFHVRRRPADCQPRKRKKKSGSIRIGGVGMMPAGVFLEVHPDGTPLENGKSVVINGEIVEVGSSNSAALQLFGPTIQPRHCILAANDGIVTLTPLHRDAHVYVNGQRVYHTTPLQHGSIIRFDRLSTFCFVDPAQESKFDRNISRSQNFDSSSLYDRSPVSPMDNNNGTSQMLMHSQTNVQNSNDPSNVTETDFPKATSPVQSPGNNESQENFNMNFDIKNQTETDQISGYVNSNVKTDNEAMLLSQHLSNSKSNLLRENNFVSPYDNQMNVPSKENQHFNKTPNTFYKDNYETTFDLDGNVETKSICSTKSIGSGNENRMQRGQEAILPAVLEFPEHSQQQFLQNVITKLDVNAPAFKLAPVYTLYLCARYRASTHYRPELTPTERAHKLTTLLHHIATLIQATVQEKYSETIVQAFWMANSSELLHFLKCDRHISAFTTQAQDILSNTVQTAFSNLVGCFHMELMHALSSFLDEGQNEGEAAGIVISVLSNAMVLLRRCRVNAALTIQLFSQLFHFINVWCFNKIVTSPYMICAEWGSLINARLAPVSVWAERQGLELTADCHLALINQCAHLLQAPKNTMEDIANLTSACFKLNSVQVRCLLEGFFQEGSGGSVRRLSPELINAAVKHAQRVADELHRADGREISLEENSSLPLSLLIPEDGFSADVVRGLLSGLTDFLAPLQQAGLCRLAPQPHSQGHWTVYMTGYNGSCVSAKSNQQPVVEVIQLQKNSNGIGLSIVAAKGTGQSKLGIYIKSVVPGGAAALDNRLQAGDQLLAVDGCSLVGITQERAAEHLVRTGPVVTLHVAKQGAILHGLATLLRQPSPQTNRGHRRMSERDLPSKVDMERNYSENHNINMVKPSKSVPALYEYTKQHEVYNPGYSRTSSNNSIPSMTMPKGKYNHSQQNDQNFYQNLSVYRNYGSNERPSNLHNSQNNLYVLSQSQQKNMPTETNVSDRAVGNQRPQSAYYSNQLQSNNSNLRNSQSTKDLVYNNEHAENYQVKGTFPSMPNVNQNYPMNPHVNANPPHHAVNHLRVPGSPLSSSQHNLSAAAMSSHNKNMHIQTPSPSQFHNNNHIVGSNPNIRGQAKLAEMSEEVTRRHQRGPLSPYGEKSLMSPLQHKRLHHGQDMHGISVNPGAQMSPTKQPPVAPKPQNLKRDLQSDPTLQILPEGPPLPPTATHPLYHQQNDEDTNYLASSSDPPAVSFYPSQRHSQNNQPLYPPNPWEREEREKEMEARRMAARAFRDQQIAALSAITEDHRTPQQEQQLRSLTLDRDFERRAQEAQDDDDKESDNRTEKMPPLGLGLLRLANNENIPQDKNILLTSPNVQSAPETITGNREQEFTHQQESRLSLPLSPVQPKSILKSNLKLDNINSPHSPNKSQKNASFSANLTPQNSKMDNLSKHDYIGNKYEPGIASKYDNAQINYLDQTNSNTVKYEQSLAYNTNNNNFTNKFETNPSSNQVTHMMGDLYISSLHRSDNLNQDDNLHNSAPPPPERGSSFAIMSHQQALRSSLSIANQFPSSTQNNLTTNNNFSFKDKHVSFHEQDSITNNIVSDLIGSSNDPDKFISEAESLLQSPTTPNSTNVMATPGVIGAQEVYKDPRQKRLAEQQKAQQAGNIPIPEKLSFKEKMKMFALESGEANTPKDKVKISRAQRDIDAIH